MTITMISSVRKFALTAHVTSSVGLLGSIAAFLALAIAGLASQDAQAVRAAYVSMELTARFVQLESIKRYSDACKESKNCVIVQGGAPVLVGR